jgi:hypothetical protein
MATPKKRTKKAPKKTDMHWRLRAGEHERFTAAKERVHADSLTSWARKALHDECDRLGIPRIIKR